MLDFVRVISRSSFRLVTGLKDVRVINTTNTIPD